MKKNIFYIMYSAVFVGVCLVPAVFTPFAKNNTSAEKRKLSEKPRIKNDDGSINFEYFSEFENYFSEHFAFRQNFVTMDGYIKSGILKTSPNSDVIAGKDGWLFYGETVNDFLNKNTLSMRGINNIKNNLRIINDYCKENGVDFIFTIAPNKNSVYPEYMPYNYIPADKSDNYENLSRVLDEDFPYCNMKDVISGTDSSIPLYHKKDTHWNNLGAYAGHMALMEMLDKSPCPSGNWTTRNDRKGDLAEMIYPSGKADDTQVYTDYDFKYKYTSRFNNFDDISIRTSCAGKDGTLLMFRDSYGEAILPFMAECFGNAEFTRTVPYRLDSIGTENSPDTVILEIVERNLPNLQKYAPLMPAPVMENITFSNLTVCPDIVLECQPSGNYTHIFGELDDKFFTSDNTDIFVSVNGITYRAFNAFEDKLLNREGETSNNGFSLYIPTIPENTAENITVISINSDGTAVSSQ